MLVYVVTWEASCTGRRKWEVRDTARAASMLIADAPAWAKPSSEKAQALDIEEVPAYVKNWVNKGERNA